MDIEKLLLYIVIGVVIVIFLIFAIIKIVQFCKLSKDEKKKVIITYLKGIVALAEQEITGTKKGEERLKMVEDYFNKHAPVIYKFILKIFGKDNLKSLIEEALDGLKQSFGG